MSSEVWQFWFGLLQAFGQVLSVLVAVWAAYFVYRYTTRRDEAEYLRNLWSEQTTLDISILGSDQLMLATEKLIYGDHYEPDIAKTKQMYVVFSVLNVVQHAWVAHQRQVLTWTEFVESAETALRLIKNCEPIAIYALTERAYPKGFAKDVMAILRKVKPPALPPAELGLGKVCQE